MQRKCPYTKTIQKTEKEIKTLKSHLSEERRMNRALRLGGPPQSQDAQSEDQFPTAGGPHVGHGGKKKATEFHVIGGGSDDEEVTDAAFEQSASRVASSPTASNGRRFQKELADIKIKKFPKTSELKQWKHDLYAETNKTSDRIDGHAVTWIREVEALSASNDSLRNSGTDFVTLDQKLAIALMAVLPSPLKRRILRMRESEMSDHDHVINGRQILLNVYKFLSTNSTMDNYYNTEDAHQVVWLGDLPEEMEKFLDNWLEILDGMRTQLSEAEKAELLHSKMKTSKVLMHELRMFRQAGHRTPHEGDNTHDYLVESIENHIADTRTEFNTKQRRDAHKAKMTAPLNANANVPGGAGKGKKDLNAEGIAKMAAALETSTKVITEAVGSLSRGGHVSPGAVPANANVFSDDLMYITTHAAYAAPSNSQRIRVQGIRLDQGEGR